MDTQEIVAPPSLTSIQESDAWKGLDESAKHKVIDTWKERTIAYGKANVQGFGDNHETLISNHAETVKRNTSKMPEPVKDGVHFGPSKFSKSHKSTESEKIDSSEFKPSDEYLQKGGSITIENGKPVEHLKEQQDEDAQYGDIMSASKVWSGKETPQFKITDNDSPIMAGVKAAGNNVVGLVDFALSPAGLATAELGIASKGVGVAATVAKALGFGVSVKFTHDLISSAMEQAGVAVDKTKTRNERIAAGVNATAAAVGAGMIARHIAEGKGNESEIKERSDNEMRDIVKRIPTEHLEAFLADKSFKDKWNYDPSIMQDEINNRLSQKAESAGLNQTADALKEQAEKPKENEQATEPKSKETTGGIQEEPGNPKQGAGAEGEQVDGGQPSERITKAVYVNPETQERTTGASHEEAAAKQGVEVPSKPEDRQTPEFQFETETGKDVQRPDFNGNPLHSHQIEQYNQSLEKPRGGPVAMSPQESAEMKAGQSTTGLKKATVTDERLQRGLSELPKGERESEQKRVGDAQISLEKDPEAANKLISRIIDDGDAKISPDDAAVLLVHRNDLMNERGYLHDEYNHPETTNARKSAIEGQLGEIEKKMERLDRAQGASGTAWGRLGRMYQAMIREDYSLDNIERRARKAKGSALSKEEQVKVKSLTEEVSKLQDQIEQEKKVKEELDLVKETNRAHEATIRDLLEEKKNLPSPAILEKVRGLIDKWRLTYDDDIRLLRKNVLGQTNMGVDPSFIAPLARIIRVHIAEVGLDLAEITTRLVRDIGEQVRPYIEPGFNEANKLIDKELSSELMGKLVKKGGKKGEKSTTDIKAKVEAEALAGDELSHKTVYDLARAHINKGVEGVDNVMAAVHKDIQEFYPDATERDVRRAFSEYGKAKFPSKDADLKALREYRTIVRLQESIDRLSEGKDAMKTGLQRDKATQAIREKQKQLNELLKKRQGPPSPEKLATNMEARKTALRNRIEDLQKQIDTGEKPPEKGKPMPLDKEGQDLVTRRDTLVEKLREIEEAKNPKPTPEQAKLNQLLEQEKNLQAKIDSGKIDPLTGKPTVDTQEIAEAKTRIKELQGKISEARKKAEQELNPPKTEADKQMDRLSAQKEKLDKIFSGEEGIEPADKKGFKALTPKAEELHTEVQYMKAWLEQWRKDAKPKTDPNYQKEQRQIKQLEESIKRYDAKIAKGSFEPDGKGASRPDTQRVAELRALKEARKDVYNAAKKASKPVLSPDERYNSRRQKQIEKQMADIEQRIQSGKYEKEPRKPAQPKDEKTNKLEVDLQKKKGEIEELIEKQRLAQRSGFEKASDFVAKWVHTSVLSHLTVLEHLVGAASENIVTRPANSTVAQLLRLTKTTDAIRRKAIYHGGWGGEMEAAKGLINSLGPTWQKLTKGKSEIDWLNEKPGKYKEHFIQVVINTHGAIKEPIRQGIYARAMELGTKAAERDGYDLSKDKTMAQAVSNDAYTIANAEIMLGDNLVTKFIRGGLGIIRNDKMNPGMARLMDNAVNIMMPVMNVPTNIAIRISRLNPAIGLGESLIRFEIARRSGALKNEAETLSRNDAELITKTFSYGIIGLGLTAYAWTHPEQFGGVHAVMKNAKRDKETGLKPGEIKVGNLTISHRLVAGPTGTYLNIIADSRRIYNEEIKNNPDSPYAAMSEAAAFALVNPFGKLPFLALAKDLTSPYKGAGQKVAGQIASRVIPGLLSDVVKAADGVDRTPKNAIQEFEQYLPILRKNVPEKGFSMKKKMSKKDEVIQ